ncbi:MAG: GntR family transcriptional regulator [Planctomycetota bacterium]
MLYTYTTLSMFLPIDPTSGLPIYRQIIAQVRRTIASGALREGEQLPSVRELSGLLGINHLTVQKAYRELERDGVLEVRRGLGMFVAAHAPTTHADASVRALAERLAVEATQAGLDRDATVRLLRERFDALDSTSTASPKPLASTSKSKKTEPPHEENR